MGQALGLLLGGVLTSYASWRWTLFVNLAFAATATVGGLLWLKNDEGADHDPLDLPGLFLVGGVAESISNHVEPPRFPASIRRRARSKRYRLGSARIQGQT